MGITKETHVPVLLTRDLVRESQRSSGTKETVEKWSTENVGNPKLILTAW